jgi:hypothetical protein
MDANSTRQLIAVFGALAFLGTVACLFAAAVAFLGTLFIGEPRLSNWSSAITRWLFGGRGIRLKILVAASILIAGYATVLVGASLASSEKVLQPGAEKYFCEIDCHLAYSIANAKSAREINGTQARGTFYVLSLRTRFDETTISSRRGNGPLEPSPKQLTLIDAAGNRHEISAAGQAALESSAAAGSPILTPLRPGESFTSNFVFDLPGGTQNAKLQLESIDSPSWIGKLVIADEASILHKKTLLAVPDAKAP